MSNDQIHQEAQFTDIGQQARIAIVAARFNAGIVDDLLSMAMQTLAKQQVTSDRVKLVRVPGAFEIPLACQRLAQTQQFDAIITLGCVVRGDTPHFDYVCSESARGILEVGLKHDLPVVYGILTTDNEQQARFRASTSDEGDNKGRDAVHTALEMLHVLSHL